MKSQGFSQTPQDIMGEYNGCSVPQYTRYPSFKHLVRVDYVSNSGLDRAVVEVLVEGYCSQNLLLTTI